MCSLIGRNDSDQVYHLFIVIYWAFDIFQSVVNLPRHLASKSHNLDENASKNWRGTYSQYASERTTTKAKYKLCPICGFSFADPSSHLRKNHKLAPSLRKKYLKKFKTVAGENYLMY